MRAIGMKRHKGTKAVVSWPTPAGIRPPFRAISVGRTPMYAAAHRLARRAA